MWIVVLSGWGVTADTHGSLWWCVLQAGMAGPGRPTQRKGHGRVCPAAGCQKHAFQALRRSAQGRTGGDEAKTVRLGLFSVACVGGGEHNRETRVLKAGQWTSVFTAVK